MKCCNFDVFPFLLSFSNMEKNLFVTKQPKKLLWRSRFKVILSNVFVPSLWKCCETFGERCFKIGKLILPSICFQAILSPLDRSCLSYEIFKSIESSKLNKMHISPHILGWSESVKLNEIQWMKTNSFVQFTPFAQVTPPTHQQNSLYIHRQNVFAPPDILLVYYCLFSVKSGHSGLHRHGLPGGVGPVEQLILSWSVRAAPIQPVLPGPPSQPPPPPYPSLLAKGWMTPKGLNDATIIQIWHGSMSFMLRFWGCLGAIVFCSAVSFVPNFRGAVEPPTVELLGAGVGASDAWSYIS